MKFDEQYEKLLNHYISEGVGTAIKDTLARTFVDPFKELNPWKSKFGNWADDRMDKKSAIADVDPKNKDQQGKTQAQGSNNSKYIESYKQTQLKSTITYNKEISFIDRGTVLGQFKFNCNDFITRKININNMLLSNATVAPNLYQQALQFLASYDLRRLRIIDSQVEKDIANAIRPALLKDKLDPANVANKTTEIINELKKYIDSIFAPINLQTQQSYIYEKAAWYFILAKYHQLKS
jgi:hypothetical protein